MKHKNRYTVVFLLVSLFAFEALTAQNYTEYFDNGNKKLEGFKNEEGVLYGNWTYYRKDGSIDSKINFENGKPKGRFILFYDNGQIQTKSSYSGEGFYEMDGAYESFFKNGQLQAKGKYKANKTVGSWVNYWEDGQIRSHIVYNENGVIQKNTEYYKNGQLRVNADYNAVGDIIGDYIVYYENGTVFQEKCFDENGNKTGIHKYFHPNGNVMEIGAYAGIDYFRKMGVWKTYYKNKQLKSKITYDENGKIVSKAFYNKKGMLIEPNK